MSQRETRQAQLSAFMKMFATDGWKLIEKDLSEALEQLTRSGWVSCESGDAFFEHKGKVLQISQMLAFRQLIEQEVANFDDIVFPDEEGESPTNPLED